MRQQPAYCATEASGPRDIVRQHGGGEESHQLKQRQTRALDPDRQSQGAGLEVSQCMSWGP